MSWSSVQKKKLSFLITTQCSWHDNSTLLNLNIFHTCKILHVIVPMNKIVGLRLYNLGRSKWLWRTSKPLLLTTIPEKHKKIPIKSLTQVCIHLQSGTSYTYVAIWRKSAIFTGNLEHTVMRYACENGVQHARIPQNSLHDWLMNDAAS